ncbi:MAG: hypothetical protein AAB250_18435 [Bdellovibrionota bacterium]
MVRIFFLAILVSISVQAREDRCYRISMPGVPGAAGLSSKTERWCYREHWAPVGSIFAYNADATEAKPELAFIIEPDETLTHGSIAGGRFTVHKVTAIGYSPFSVPRWTPEGSSVEVNPNATNPEFNASVERAHELLAKRRSDPSAKIASLAIEAGTFQGAVPPAALPFRGYYWPTRNQTLASAMKKLDAFAAPRGVRSRAYAWERDHHEYRGLSWSGHCNGWAASSVLREEPNATRYDEKSNVTFLVSDQKGLMAERDYCVSYSFYGRRYPNGVLEDVTPGQFHQVVTYTIGTLGKPVAADLTRTRPVLNNVYSAYRSVIVSTAPREFDVTTEIRDHYYETSLDQRVGRAPSQTLRYRYHLSTDELGNITGGKWLSTNPDFLWVPLSGARCSDENPYVTDTMLNMIVKLPTPVAISN